MKIEDFVLKTSDDEIPWRLFTPEKAGKDYCVLWIQGWSSTMDSHREGVEKMSKESGVVFATLDPAGHGLHKLPIDLSTKKQQHEEVVAIFDELKKHGYEKIIVIGGSHGGYMAALLTGERPVHAAVLRCPANYWDDELEMPFKQTRLAKHQIEERAVDSLAYRSIKNFNGFVYILEHELDEVILPRVPKKFFDVAKHGNYIIVPKTKHSPKSMDNPRPHYDYIEHIVVSIIKAVKLQDKL